MYLEKFGIAVLFDVYRLSAIKPKPPREYKCIDCSTFKMDLPQLKNDIWLSQHGPKVLSCWDCFEKRLGRNLTMGDLENCNFTNTIKKAMEKLSG